MPRADRMRPWRSAVAVAAAVAALPAPALAQDPPAPRVQSVALGLEPHEVVAADVSGDGLADLVVSAGAGARRRVCILRQRTGGMFPGEPDQALVPPREAYALLVADLLPTPGDEVGYVCTDGVRVHRPADGTLGGPERLLAAAGFVELPPRSALTRWDGTTDLDGDGWPDLLLPQRAGYLVAFQGRDRAFAQLAALPVTPEERVVSRAFPLAEVDLCGSVRMLPRLVPADFDGDGRTDLLALHRDRLTGFLQRDAGRLGPAPSFEASIAFLRPRVAAGTADEFERKRPFFADLDGDRRADLVVVATEGTIGLWSSIRTTVAVFRGRADALYAARPDQVLLLAGAPLGVELRDVTGDGQPDLLAVTARTDLLGVALAGGIQLTTRLHLGVPGGFAETPALEDTVDVTGSTLDRGDPVPQGLHGADVTGDGYPDRVTYDREGRLAVRRARPAGEGALAIEEAPWCAGTVPTGAIRLEALRCTAPPERVPRRADVLLVLPEGLALVSAPEAGR